MAAFMGEFKKQSQSSLLIIYLKSNKKISLVFQRSTLLQRNLCTIRRNGCYLFCHLSGKQNKGNFIRFSNLEIIRNKNAFSKYVRPVLGTDRDQLQHLVIFILISLTNAFGCFCLGGGKATQVRKKQM